MSEEIFGPILPILLVDSADEAIRSILSRYGRIYAAELYLFLLELQCVVSSVVVWNLKGNTCFI